MKGKTKMKIFKLGKDEFVSICLCILVSMVSLVSSLNGILNHLIANGTLIGTMLVYGAFFFFLIASLALNNFAIKHIALPMLLFFLTVTAFSLWTNPDISEFVYKKGNTLFENAIFVFFALTFSGLVLTTYLNDYNVLFKYMERFSYAVIILAFVQYFFFKLSVQYMAFSYNLLLQAVFITLLCIKEFKISRFICAAMGFALILVAGSRGALVSFLICTLLYIIVYPFNSSLKKLMVTILIAGLILLIYKYFEEIIIFANKLLLELDISSRTLIKIAEREFDNDSGRSLIQERLFENLNLFGHGFFADRLVGTGSYAHNLFIELVYSFGILGGGFLFGVLCLAIITAFVKSSDIERIIIISFISTGFIRLMFSGSFLNQEPGFYTLIGVCASIIKHTKHKVKTAEIRHDRCYKKNYIKS